MLEHKFETSDYMLLKKINDEKNYENVSFSSKYIKPIIEPTDEAHHHCPYFAFYKHKKIPYGTIKIINM